ncbi:MAG: GGDEF domain-containing protein [Alphaproteobacteria bacterium]|nr:GGDEF domain-containing protein [Alphaproteobacteria bacterium]MBV8411675.1 GGDEF domain-containing protein [Alphaproteobacteria bacterium]
MQFDIATLYLISSAVLALSAVASWGVWSKHRDDGWLLCWSLATGVSAVSLLPLGLYGASPPVEVAAGSVVLLMSGYALAWESMRLFNGRRPRRLRLVLFVVLFALVLGTSAGIGATTPQVASIASAALAVVAFMSAYEVLRRGHEFQRMRQAIAGLFAVMAAVMAARAGLAWLAPAEASAATFEDPLGGVSPLAKTACVIGLSISLMMIANERVTDRHQRLALTDELTGLPNRRSLPVHAERFARRGNARTRLACVLMMDLDHFSRLNEALGHAGGDDALVWFAGLLRQMMRDDDFVARYGGEEFCALLSDVDCEDAVRIAEQIRTRLAAAPLDSRGRSYRITVSIGVAAVRDGDIDRALRAADQALYVAKARGRDRVVAEGSDSAEARAADD